MPRPLTTLLLLVAVAAPAAAADVPDPASALGFRPGDDFKLASWKSVVDYANAVDRASDRVVVRELGRTTEGRPYIVAVVSSEANIRDLDRQQALHRKIADPRLFGSDREADEALAAAKPVVLITCSIHSTETASTLMAADLLHDLAARDDPATREVLDGAILLLVPSANPDGVDIVADWYPRTIGTPWEGSGLPRLYHKYAGHDTNRDWFMLNLRETQLLTRLLYREWFPTLTYDVHQMGSRGARIFVPPFFDPTNPNLDPRISQGIALIGSHMAADLAASGRRGVLTNAMYDNWWNGGNRTTPQRHNMVGVLTESASVKLASPIFLDKDDLRGATRGFADHRAAVNFTDPWPGGWWRLRDVVEYERACAASILTLAARYGRQFLANQRAMGRDAIAKGRSEPPFGWVVPAEQRDPGTAAEMVRILRETGIEVRRLRSPLAVSGASYPAGSFVLPAAQPFRAHLKDMMERQVYPDRFGANGQAEPPYDVAGWTLPLQMGVHAAALNEPFADESEVLDVVEPPKGKLDADQAGPTQPFGEPFFAIANRTNADFLAINALLAAGVEAELFTEAWGDDADVAAVADAQKTLEENPLYRDADEGMKGRMVSQALSSRGIAMGPLFHPRVAAGTVRVPATPRATEVLDRVAAGSPARVARVSGRRFEPKESAALGIKALNAPAVGLYQPWVPSMDEGWTRLVLEKFQFRYSTLHDAEVRGGGLAARYRVIILPSVESKTLREGYKVDESEPAYTGGLGPEGAEALREFAREGGTLVCLENASEYAIEALGLPVRNVVQGLKTSEFYGPGSIVRVAFKAGNPITLGMPEEGSAYFDRSLAFEPSPNNPEGMPIEVLVSYARDRVLQSGWLLGPEKIAGKGAVVTVGVGRGRVVLFGFPPQHRGQTHGTFRLLFNAILSGGMGGR